MTIFTSASEIARCLSWKVFTRTPQRSYVAVGAPGGNKPNRSATRLTTASDIQHLRTAAVARNSAFKTLVLRNITLVKCYVKQSLHVKAAQKEKIQPLEILTFI